LDKDSSDYTDHKFRRRADLDFVVERRQPYLHLDFPEYFHSQLPMLATKHQLTFSSVYLVEEESFGGFNRCPLHPAGFALTRHPIIEVLRLGGFSFR